MLKILSLFAQVQGAAVDQAGKEHHPVVLVVKAEMLGLKPVKMVKLAMGVLVEREAATELADQAAEEAHIIMATPEAAAVVVLAMDQAAAVAAV